MLQPKAILLGNGFSRAYNDTLFDYKSLLTAAAFDDRIGAVFDKLHTTDFEQVMRRLTQARALARIYGVSKLVRSEMAADINAVRSGLIRAVGKHHPRGADQLNEDDYATCAAFLRPYSTIYTLNYDLLLYWVIVEKLSDVFKDGFGGRTLRWGINPQNTYYLHGALHLYVDEDDVVRKLGYRKGPTIIAQLRDAFIMGRVPLFVSEGSSMLKLQNIKKSAYLEHCYNQLCANTMPLTLYGFRFGFQDKHITDAISKSKTPALTVVLHSGSSASSQQPIRDRANRLASSIILPKGASATISFVESRSLSVWR